MVCILLPLFTALAELVFW